VVPEIEIASIGRVHHTSLLGYESLVSLIHGEDELIFLE
jgi:hypothetical protein